MPLPKAVNRRILIRKLKNLGFDGPYSGSKHQYMIKEQIKLVIPNPHKGEISGTLLVKILQQAGISQEDWEQN